MKYAHIINAFVNTPWAIVPEKLYEMTAFLELQAAGFKLSDEQIKSQYQAASNVQNRNVGSIAVINIHGVVSQRLNLLSAMSGGTSTELIAKEINNAVHDDTVGSIVLNIDSPGGSVYGVEELSDVIYQARSEKQITAVANSLSASAAYWIGSAATEFVVTPGGDVGSIGVITAHGDWSAYVNEPIAGNAGLPKVTYISAGKYKAEGNPYEPLTDEAHAAIQSRVDEYYDSFVSAVARNRGVSVAVVASGFGEGRVVGAEEAVSLGMADRVGTLESVLSQVTQPNNRMNAINRLSINERV